MDRNGGAVLICAECGSDNPREMRFCGWCGAALPRLCPACDAENPPALRFCGQCGKPLGETQGSLETPADDVVAAKAAAPGTALEDLIEILEECEPAYGALPEDLIEIMDEGRQEASGPAPSLLICRVCATDNPPTAVHCELCGAVVAPAGAPCPACAFPNRTGSLFCDNCGERLGLAELL
jgi:ribosomal protein L40E